VGQLLRLLTTGATCLMGSRQDADQKLEAIADVVSMMSRSTPGEASGISGPAGHLRAPQYGATLDSFLAQLSHQVRTLCTRTVPCTHPSGRYALLVVNSASTVVVQDYCVCQWVPHSVFAQSAAARSTSHKQQNDESASCKDRCLQSCADAALEGCVCCRLPPSSTMCPRSRSMSVESGQSTRQMLRLPPHWCAECWWHAKQCMYLHCHTVLAFGSEAAWSASAMHRPRRLASVHTCRARSGTQSAGDCLSKHCTSSKSHCIPSGMQ
jgi:hypothetical protein